MKPILPFIFCCLFSFFATGQKSSIFFDAGTNFYQADYNGFYQTDNNDPGLAIGFGYQYNHKTGAKLALVGGVETHYGRLTQQTQEIVNESGLPPFRQIQTMNQFVTSDRVQMALVLGLVCELGKWNIQFSALPTYVVHSKVRYATVTQIHQFANEVRRETEFIPRGEWFGESEQFEGNRIWYSSRFTLNGQAGISRAIGRRFNLGLTYNQALTYQQLQFDPRDNCFEQFDDCNTTEPRKFMDPRLRRLTIRFAYFL